MEVDGVEEDDEVDDGAYKRERAHVRTQVLQTHKSSHSRRVRSSSPNLQAINHTVDVGYYAQASQTTLNPCVLLMFIRLKIKHSLTSPKLILS
jgi:hypothetical protein